MGWPPFIDYDASGTALGWNQLTSNPRPKAIRRGGQSWFRRTTTLADFSQETRQASGEALSPSRLYAEVRGQYSR